MIDNYLDGRLLRMLARRGEGSRNVVTTLVALKQAQGREDPRFRLALPFRLVAIGGIPSMRNLPPPRQRAVSSRIRRKAPSWERPAGTLFGCKGIAFIGRSTENMIVWIRQGFRGGTRLSMCRTSVTFD